MSGQIIVKPIEDIMTQLEVFVNDFSAIYYLDYFSFFYDFSGSRNESESNDSDEQCYSWLDVAANFSIYDPPVFLYSECYTPIVDSIDSGNSTLYTTYTIYGNRFGHDLDDITITFGGIKCYPSYVEYDSILCTLNMTSMPIPFTVLPLQLHINDLGYALLKGQYQHDRSITINPIITSITPSRGSLLGGNTIVINGASFIENNLSVYIGNEECTVIEVEYGMIWCQVPALVQLAYNATLPVNVTYGTNMSAVWYDQNECSYEYSMDFTPVVFSIEPTVLIGDKTATITINGALLDSDSIIKVGEGYECVNITQIDQENITCEMEPIPAGSYEISVLVLAYGYADFDEMAETMVTSELQVTSISPTVGSTRGGTALTVTGYGFSNDLEANNVFIGNVKCEVIESSYSTIVCITPDVSKEGNGTLSVSITPNVAKVDKRNINDGIDTFQFEFSQDFTPSVDSILPTSGQEGDTVVITGNKLSTDECLVTVTIGTSECIVTSSTDTSIECTLGPAFVGTYAIDVIISTKGRADGNIEFNYTLRVESVIPTEGSFAGQNILTINGVGLNPVSTFITICNMTCSPSSDPPSLTTVSCIVPSFSQALQDMKVCNITVTSLSSTVVLEDAYTFRRDLTPIVTSIDDTRGGTAGGTVIQLTGSGFDGNPSVTIAGVSCSVIDSTETAITCTTGASGRTIKAPVMVYLEGKGFALSDDIEFYYVDLWSSEYTWGGLGLPEEGFFVIVPAGQTLVLDIATPILTILLIQGGELIFDDKEDGVELNSELILITGGGTLQIGTEDNPYQHKAKIVLYGNVLSTELPIYGAKTLAVRNGTLDLHGKPIATTWTRLSMTAEAGDTTIHLQDDVSDWEIGGVIAIASTSYSQRENEEATIAGISEDGMSINLRNPLEYRHISYQQTIHGRMIETRAEVGYLTRNVVVRGNRNEEWDVEYEACEAEFDPGQFAVQTCFNGRFGAETVGDQFGSQIMLHKGPNNKVVGRIEYIEVTHAGQAFRLGRYPIHFHLNGDVSDSYVRGCGIHHTFNRAVTIHAVDYLLVEKNVAYNIMGHAYFLEDGIEQGNIIQDNLGIFVRASSSLLNVDITPATFWVVNPNNTLRRNAAAGGSHFGFWYRLPENPTGPSFTTSVEPLHLPLGEFTNNSAHSFGWYGIWIFPSYHPGSASTCDERTPAVFENFLSWRNVRGVEFSEVGAVQLKHSVMLDNQLAGVEYTLVTAAWGKNGSLIEDVLIVAHSGLREYDNVTVRGSAPICTVAGVKTPHSYYLTVSNVTFVNFNETNCFAVQACSHCRVNQGGFETRFEKVELHNSPNVVSWQWQHEQVLRDLDGTLTGISGGALMPWMNALPSEYCQIYPNSGGAVEGAICNANVQFIRFALRNPIPSSLTFRKLNATSQHGTVALEYVFKRIIFGPGYMGIIPTSEIYTLEWSEGERFNNISYESLYSGVTNNDYIWIRHDFNMAVDYIEVNGKFTNASTSIPSAVTSETGDWFTNSNDTSVTYIVQGTDICPSDELVRFTSYRCFYEDCIPPPPPEPPSVLPPGRPNVTYMWSNTSIWPNGILPANDTDVYINCSLYVIADIVLPVMKQLTICGSLEILDDRDHILEADLILLDEGGRLIAGLPDEHFQHKLDIILHGNLSSSIYRLPNDGPVLGAKAIGVFGQLILHGQERVSTWTFLQNTAVAGASEIAVSTPVDWKVGEEIVIASTSYEANQAEEFVINAVSEDGQTLTLDHPLVYNHLGGVHNTDSLSVNISAEVGLLSRNIRILGTTPDAEVDTAYAESYGCRVLVSTYINDFGIQLTGSAQLYGVEMKGCGQEGFVETFDPRYSLVFLNTGLVTDNSSYVTDCSFHNGYNTGIGVFGATSMTLQNNVVHNTVGPSIYVTGSSHTLKENLAVVAQFPGTYRGRDEPWNFEWTANYELTSAIDIMLIGNSAAGGARAGYHTNGENCLQEGFAPIWKGNIAHSTLHGIHIGYTDGHSSGDVEGCSSLNDFTIYSSYHYGIFSYSRAGIQISECTLVNNYAAIFTAVIGPAALTHVISEKDVQIRNTCIISSIHQPLVDCDEYSYKPTIAFHETSHSGIQTPDQGHVGVILTTFTSGRGHFPKASWSSVITYPAITGLTILQNVSFSDFGTHCGSKEVALMTHPNSEDCQHPVETSDIKLINVAKESKFFNHMPILNSINPADCVDMDCDAFKKVLIRDVDGSFTESEGLNTIFSQAEFEWDGDVRRGIGDYRIPRTMIAEPDGGMIDPDVVYPNKGIYRGESNQCVWESEWNAYHCTDIDHMMLVLESLDLDTEVRRLSPIGVAAGSYIDLGNGPQDHGWCGGYTCQERISTFYFIVATGLEYTVGLTSTNPQNMHIYLLNAAPDQAIVIAIIYTNPQRLDIFVDSDYITPTNGYYEDGNLRYLRGNDDDFIPTISDSHGTNYYSRASKKLYIVVKGDKPVMIVTSQVIQLGFNLPAVTVDEFFEENLISNLALLLGIPPNRIRIVNVISESETIKRQTSGTRVEVEIGEAPSNTTRNETATDGGSYNNQTNTTSSTTDDVEYMELLTIATRAGEVIQNGKLSEEIGVQILSAVITEPEPIVTDPTNGVRATPDTGGPQPEDDDAENLKTFYEQQLAEEQAEANTTESTQLSIPHELSVVHIPTSGIEGILFARPIKIVMLDNMQQIVSNLGVGIPWELTVSLTSSPQGSFVTNSTVDIGSGEATFSDTFFSHAGTYSLQFDITYPTDAVFSLQSTNDIEISYRELYIEIVTQPPSEGNTTFTLYPYPKIYIRDSINDDIVMDLGWRGREWFAVATIIASNGDEYGITHDVQIEEGVAVFSNINFQDAGTYKIQFSVKTDPSTAISRLPDNIESEEVDIEVLPFSRFEVTYEADFMEVIGENEDEFISAFVKFFYDLYPDIVLYNVTVRSGSIIISFFATTKEAQQLADFATEITEGNVTNRFVFNNISLNNSTVFQDPAYPIIFPTEPPEAIDTHKLIIVIVSVAIGSSILLVMAILTVGIFCYFGTKRKSTKIKMEPYENEYEQYPTNTIYRNSPIFDEDGDYPLFHLVENGQKQLAFAKEVDSQSVSRSSTTEALPSQYKSVQHVVSKEIKVGNDVTVFQNPNLTQGESDGLSLSELLELKPIGSQEDLMKNNNNSNNNSNDTSTLYPPALSLPNAVPDPQFDLRASPTGAGVSGVSRTVLPPLDETIHGLKITSFN